MNALFEILSPDFLLRQALIGSVLVGLVCPLVGVYFVLRRMIFLGVALPQLSAAGIACAFFVYRVVVGPHQHFGLTERSLAMIGSFAFTLTGLLILAALERHKETVEARMRIWSASSKGTSLPPPVPASESWQQYSAPSCLSCSRSAKNSSWSRSIATWQSCSANASGCGIVSFIC